MKSKRTGLDVLHQLHDLTGLARAHPELVEKATQSMTPEQLRKAHEGLSVLRQCIGPVAAATGSHQTHAAPALPAAAGSPAASLAARPAPRAEPAIESS